jgi:hypothetical protein
MDVRHAGPVSAHDDHPWRARRRAEASQPTVLKLASVMSHVLGSGTAAMLSVPGGVL